MAHPRLRYHALVVFLLALAPVLLMAQKPPFDSQYKMAPAIAGSDARIFVGLQRGTILYADPSASNPMASDSVIVTDSATPGQRLPAEVASIWFLSMPDRVNLPQLVVGLVSYRDGGTQRYGFIRSMDLGGTWTLVKPAALADPSFVVSSDYWSWQTLTKMTWLPDGQHGWIYGDKGIVATTDGGSTWEIRFNGGADALTVPDGANSGATKALAFRDALNGAAAMGWALAPRLYMTADGGDTLYPKTGVYGYKPWVQMDWIGGEFRALQFDRSVKDNQGITTYFWASDDGAFWTPTAIGAITREQTYHTEVHWADARNGVMILRSGEMWRTTNRGRAWARYKDADSVRYRMPLGSSSGFGYRSVLLSDRIVQASTLLTQGGLYRLIQWPVALTGVEDDAPVRAALEVAPNPADARAVITADAELTATASVSLIDAAGRTLKHLTSGRDAIGSRTITIDLSGVPAGIYRVVLRNGARLGSAPLVVR